MLFRSVVHTFVKEWREHSNDLRCNLSVANYRYNDEYILWASGKNDTPETAQEKDADPTKAQKEKQNYTRPNGTLRNM